MRRKRREKAPASRTALTPASRPHEKLPITAEASTTTAESPESKAAERVETTAGTAASLT